MRPGKVWVLATYAMALAALAFYVVAWLNAADACQAAWYAANGCFLLLASIWSHVCS